MRKNRGFDSMITLKNYKDHKPKRITFMAVNWQDDQELRDEIIRDETPEERRRP